MEIFEFCVITRALQNDRLNLSFVKKEHTVSKKMARNAKILKYIIVIYCESEYVDGVETIRP